MRFPALHLRLSVDATVRLLLTAVMGLILAAMVLLSSGQPAAAQSAGQQSFALSRADIVARLDQRYQEAPVAGGIAANGHILEVFAAPDGVSWTIIVTRPDGMSRVVAQGEGWSFIAVLTGQRI